MAKTNIASEKIRIRLKAYDHVVLEQCFKCFKCFRCFISLFDHKIARFWSKSEQNRCFKCSKPAAPNQAANPQKRYFTV